MADKTDGIPAFRFSTADLPEKDRLEIWREEFGRALVKVDFEPIPDVPFACSATVRSLPRLSVITGLSNGYRLVRTPQLIADGNDDLILNIATRGGGVMSQVCREVAVGAGDGLLLSSSDVGTAMFPEPVEFISLGLSRPALRALVADPEAVLITPIPERNHALRLLTNYMSALEGAGALMNPDPIPDVADTFAAHILDLVALAIGATRDGMELARGRGLRAARLYAIKVDIRNSLHRADLSVAIIAARHGVTPRYVQMLFAAEGVTFSEYVLGQRLACVRRMLEEPRFAGRTISAIAYEVGLGDLSHFNRAFRRHFGITPSDVRAAVRRDAKQ
jgi:AraC-like DNA-binding protein